MQRRFALFIANSFSSEEHSASPKFCPHFLEVTQQSLKPSGFLEHSMAFPVKTVGPEAMVFCISLRRAIFVIAVAMSLLGSLAGHLREPSDPKMPSKPFLLTFVLTVFTGHL